MRGNDVSVCADVRPETYRVGGVGDENRGEEIQARRMALGLTVKDLALRAKVDRGTLAAIEAGAHARSSTLGALDKALTQLEDEMSGPYDRPGLITFRLKGNFGVEATVQGPVENADTLREQVERLIEKMGTGEDGPQRSE